MPVGTTGFIGERLAEAREARGLSNSSLAEILGLSATAISQYERGFSTPRPEITAIIAEKLNLPRSFFLRKLQSNSFNVLFWRSMTSATKAARIKARRKFEWLKDISAYLKEYLDFPELNFPDSKSLGVPPNPLELSNQKIENIAEECREFWKLGNAPIADFVLFLENNGAVITRGRLEVEKLDAFSQFSDTDQTPYIFLMSDKESAVRSRLDAAHELGHLILHGDVQEKHLANPQIYKTIEEQAFLFGSAFLMPSKAFTDELWLPSLDAFRSLKERWRVSIGAMIKRCNELGLISDNETARIWISYNRRGWKKREPLDDDLISEQPRLLRRSFELLIDENIKTREQILHDLSYSANDIEDLAGLPSGYFREELGQIKVFPKIKTQENTANTNGTVIQFTRNR